MWFMTSSGCHKKANNQWDFLFENGSHAPWSKSEMVFVLRCECKPPDRIYSIVPESPVLRNRPKTWFLKCRKRFYKIRKMDLPHWRGCRTCLVEIQICRSNLGTSVSIQAVGLHQSAGKFLCQMWDRSFSALLAARLKRNGERESKRERTKQIDRYIYIYICCRVDNLAIFWPF